MAWPDDLSRRGACLFAADEDDLGLLLSDEVLDGAAEPCPLVSQIVELGFTDQPAANALFAGQRNQYVNLGDPALRQADPDILSDNQVGRRPAVFVRVSPARATRVRLKLERTLLDEGFPGRSASLSAREQGLSHLHWARTEQVHTTNDNGELLLEPGLRVAALAGAEYRLQAALEGQGFVTSTNSVKVMRKVYVRPVVRYAHGRGRALEGLRRVASDLQRLGIEVKLLPARTSGGELGVRTMASVHPPLTDIGRAALRSSSRTPHIEALAPHSLAVIVQEFIDDGHIQTRTHEVEVPRNEDGSLDTFPQVDLRLGSLHPVVVPLSDHRQVVGVHLRSAARSLDLPPETVQFPDVFDSVVFVDIGDYVAGFGATETVSLTVELKSVTDWFVGFAYYEHPVMYLNMRDPNRQNDLISASAVRTLVTHELAHKFHLTTNNADGQPDQRSTHYGSFDRNGVRHVGEHCSHGVPAGTDLWSDAAQAAADCTMWGYIKAGNRLCNECRTSLRKVNLGGGF